MSVIAILNMLLETIPQALLAYEKIRATLTEQDLAALDLELAAGDKQMTVDHDALRAAIAAAIAAAPTPANPPPTVPVTPGAPVPPGVPATPKP